MRAIKLFVLLFALPCLLLTATTFAGTIRDTGRRSPNILAVAPLRPAWLDEYNRRKAAVEERVQKERRRKSDELASTVRRKVSRAGLSWPRVDMITSHFGRRRSGKHSGMDILCSRKGGEPIFAANNGRVHTARTMPIYGKAVILVHGGQTKTLYAHLSWISVRAGQQVRRGQVIGYCGSTGNSTAPHLHFEYYRGGRPINPLHYLPAWT